MIRKINLREFHELPIVAHRVRIVARGLEGRGLVQLVGLVLLRVLVLEQVEPVLLLSPALLAVACHFSGR